MAEVARWTMLCVDDEPNIVAALRRLFRGAGYRVLTATSGAEALALFESEPIDLVMSDMRMPGMDGAQLLEQVRRRWPSATRLLLTGYADVQSSMAAINQGEVYRYLTKPWNDNEVLLAVREAFERQALERERRRLQALTQQQADELKALNASLEIKVALRTEDLKQAGEKLKKNYLASIKAFSNLIELRGGQFVGHARRMADLARRTARAMGLSETDQQEVFIAGLLHDMGQIGLPDALLARSVPRLSDEESLLYRRHPVLGEQALLALDDMQRVAALIRSHHERHDGRGFPDGLQGHDIPAGARILAVADTFDDLQSGHLGAALSVAEARTIILRGRGTQFDPEAVDIFLQTEL
ncbi:MAG: HD domain-containing phosphohydrolase, partial [Rubrivivax sp.]